MTSHRSRFLASLHERLESDLASRERNRDDPPPARLEHTGPGSADETSPEEAIAGDEIAGAPSQPAAQIDPEQDAESELVASPQRGRRPPLGALVSSEGEHTLHPSVPWSETGMPLRLREAIASARRISQEMQEVPLDDDAVREPVPYGDRADDHDDDDAAFQGPPPEEPEALLEDEATPEDEQTESGRHSAYEEAPPDELVQLEDEATPEEEQTHSGRHEPSEEAPPPDELVLLEDESTPDDEQTESGRHSAYEEAPPDELVLLEDDVIHEDGQSFIGDHEAFDEPSPDDDLISLDEEDAAYRHEQPLDGDAADRELLPGNEAAHEQMWLDDDGARQESASEHSEALEDRQPLRRGATTRYGVHAAAFAVAIAFVALAGFGLGIVSGGGDTREPLARDTLRASPTQPAPSSSGQEARPAEPEAAELSELVTVRVAPAPVAAVPEPAPTARNSTSAPPLPPPPKPALPQSATGEAAPTDSDVEGTVDDAFAALLEGAGGPFEPLFAKLPASRPIETQVFVHYTAGAVGAPATAMHLVRHLKAAGFAVEVRPVEFPIPRNSIRYFFDADREQAEALRSSLEDQIPDGTALSVMDFRSYQPRPEPGVIEVWLRA